MSTPLKAIASTWKQWFLKGLHAYAAVLGGIWIAALPLILLSFLLNVIFKQLNMHLDLGSSSLCGWLALGVVLMGGLPLAGYWMVNGWLIKKFTPVTYPPQSETGRSYGWREYFVIGLKAFLLVVPLGAAFAFLTSHGLTQDSPRLLADPLAFICFLLIVIPITGYLRGIVFRSENPL